METNKLFNHFTFYVAICLLFVFTSCQNPESEFKKAQDINTIEAYNNFIEKYPTDTLIIEAKNHLARLEYINFAKDPSLEDLLKFIEKYSDSNYLDSAKQKLLTEHNYDGITMKAELVEYSNEKALTDLFPGSIHLSESTKVYWRYSKGSIVKVIGISDYIKGNDYPKIIRLIFYNHSDTIKKISVKGLNYILIRISPEKMISAKGISGKTPAVSFPVAIMTDCEFIYEIPTNDYIEFGFLFTEAKKDDLIIFDSSFVTKIL